MYVCGGVCVVISVWTFDITILFLVAAKFKKKNTLNFLRF